MHGKGKRLFLHPLYLCVVLVLIQYGKAHPCRLSCFSVNGKSNNHNIDIDDERREQQNPSSRLTTKKRAKRIRPRIPVLEYHDDWVCVR